MSDSKQKYEEITEEQSYTGLGFYTQTTTQDELLEIDNFVKNDETLMRDLIEEFRNWNYQWESWRPDGIYPKPINVDQFISEISKKYKVKLR